MNRTPLVYAIVMMIIVALSMTTYTLLTRTVFPFQTHGYSESHSLKEEIKRIVEEVKHKVEEIRGLKFPPQSKVIIINKTWVMEHWGPPPKPSKQMLYKEMVYKLTLLVPPNFSIVKGEAEWTASFMAATAGYTLYIVEENFNPKDPTALRAIAHELTHILQYHYFHPKYPSTLDGRLAVLALIEGDADFVADRFCNLTGIPPRPQLGIPVDNPYIALQSFPYIFGEKFIAYLYRKANNTWTLVNKAYSNPPKSTEQVMHPEKYLQGENPVQVKLVVNETTRPVLVDTMGEYYILLILATKTKPQQAIQAAKGWGGDLLALYYDNKTKEWKIYWNITWDTEEDAKEFYNTLTQALENIGAKITTSQNKTIATIWNYTITITIQNKTTLITSRTNPE